MTTTTKAFKVRNDMMETKTDGLKTVKALKVENILRSLNTKLDMSKIRTHIVMSSSF